MLIQLAVYVFLFIIPYFLLTFTALDGFYLRFCVYMSLLGAMIMYFYEVMAIVVEGPKVYFKDYWNWIDAITLPLYILLSTINLSIADHPGASNHDLIQWRRVLNSLMFTTVWIKVTWYQKL